MIKTVSKLAFLALGLMTFSACEKEDEKTKVTIAYVTFIHASPDAPKVDIAVQNVPVATGAAFGAASAQTGLVRELGKQYKGTVKVNPAGATLFTIDNPTWDDKKRYSMWVVDSAAKAKLIQVQDIIGVADTFSCLVRFVHAVPNAPNVDIRLGGTTTPLFANIPFLGTNPTTGYTEYQKVYVGRLPAANPTRRQVFQLLAAGGTDPLATATITLNAGKAYTIWARGTVGGTGAQALGLGQVTH
jgi:hypothetical protein